VYYFFGGLLMVLGGFLEFILGNTFPFVVFSSFGAFWLSFGATLTPYFNASIAYLPSDPAASSSDPVFASTFAFFHVYMGVLCFVYLIVALRTNIVFVLIFATLVAAFGCLAEFFFQIGEGKVNLTMQHAAGGCTFVTSLLGWYLFIVQLLASVDFPINLPVGDLSRFIKGASERASAKEE
jgi:succinate-acetate transporter protein